MINIIAKEIVYRIEKLEGLLEALRRELNREKINRDRIQNMLFKTKELLDSLRILSKRHKDVTDSTIFARFINLAQKAQSQKGSVSVEELFNIFASPKLPIGDIESLSSYIGTILTLFTHASDKLNDEYYREKLYEVIPKIKALAEGIAASIGGAELGALPKLGRLLTLTTKWEFGEKWAVAMAYLQALEVIINKLIKDYSIQVEEKAGFKMKFQAVVKVLKDKAVELAELEKQLPPVFWDLRHKVVHAGYEPSNEELDTIITWTLQILEKVGACTSFHAT